MDADSVKADQLKQWSGAAAGWRKHDAVMQARLAAVTERMAAPLRPGQRVLDLCSGTGEPALAVAQRVLPGGQVIGIDFAEEMLAVAREKAAQRGLSNVAFRRMDAEALDFAAAHFDAATFRFGLMFMPDPAGCLAGIRRVLKPGALLSITCWAEAKLNPWASIPAAVARKYVALPEPKPDAPGPFAFADKARLSALLESAGFSRVRVEPMELVMSDVDTGAEFVAALLDLGVSLRALMDRLPPGERQRMAAEIASEAERAGGGRARLKGVAWFATATG